MNLGIWELMFVGACIVCLMLGGFIITFMVPTTQATLLAIFGTSALLTGAMALSMMFVLKMLYKKIEEDELL